MSFFVCGSFKHSVGTEKIDKQIIWNTFDTVIRIIPIIIIFGTTSVVHKGITFGAVSRDRDIVTVVPFKDIITFKIVPRR